MLLIKGSKVPHVLLFVIQVLPVTTLHSPAHKTILHVSMFSFSILLHILLYLTATHPFRPTRLVDGQKHFRFITRVELLFISFNCRISDADNFGGQPALEHSVYIVSLLISFRNSVGTFDDPRAALLERTQL